MLYKLVLLAAVVAIAALVFLMFFRNNNRYKIPSIISKQLSFPVLFLNNPTATYKLDSTTVKYTSEPDGSKDFNFIVYSSTSRITISEQAYPDVLIYDKVTNSVNPYSEIGTVYGEVTLGKPKDGGGRQTAVLDYSGATLIFAQPTNALSNNDWRQLFNSLDTIK